MIINKLKTSDTFYKKEMGNKRRISFGGTLPSEAEIKGIFFFFTARLQSAGIAETLL